MKAETKEDLRSDVTVSGVPCSWYTFWRKVSAIASMSSEAVMSYFCEAADSD